MNPMLRLETESLEAAVAFGAQHGGWIAEVRTGPGETPQFFAYSLGYTPSAVFED